MAELDHLILAVGDVQASAKFYAEILGFALEGSDGPFTVVRVTPALTIQLAPWGTQGGDHLAFAMSSAEFEAVFDRVKAVGIEFGDAFDAVGSMKGPGREMGAKGMGKALYFFDPSRHLIEIRTYE
ncbi:MAG: VOC family protein [Deltaproteobacteria bacterium]|nr:VOC family protein [Deltaproteobacteria bacterium]MBI3388548.1 VOC family protein [Deltaproteobacteria bacterium]